jgi:hypothetical protein
METLFFILGIASVVVTAIAVVAVVSIVKVVKTEQNLSALERNLSALIGRIERSTALDDLSREIHDRIDDVQKVFDSSLNSRLDKLNGKHERSIEELHRIFNEYIHNKLKN